MTENKLLIIILSIIFTTNSIAYQSYDNTNLTTETGHLNKFLNVEEWETAPWHNIAEQHKLMIKIVILLLLNIILVIFLKLSR